MAIRPSLQRFTELARTPENRVRLDEAALEVARIGYPTLNTARCLARLDELAERTWTRRMDGGEPLGFVSWLNRSLFQTEGFRGNEADYYEPQNSFLNDVLDRKIGIPITLSVVYMEVARRLGFQVEGIGFPGHFMVRAQVDGRTLHVDPFNAGRLLTSEDCQNHLDQTFGAAIKLDPSFLAPVGSRYILTRLLNNLKSIYLFSKNLSGALAVVERLILLQPEDAGEQRDRGKLWLALGEPERAASDLESYLYRDPEAEDLAEVRALIQRIRRRQAQVN